MPYLSQAFLPAFRKIPIMLTNDQVLCGVPWGIAADYLKQHWEPSAFDQPVFFTRLSGSHDTFPVDYPLEERLKTLPHYARPEHLVIGSDHYFARFTVGMAQVLAEIGVDLNLDYYVLPHPGTTSTCILVNYP